MDNLAIKLDKRNTLLTSLGYLVGAIVCGDIFISTLVDIYYNHETFCNLRKENIPEECLECRYCYLCRGGAKCQSYATFGIFQKADPACFLRKRKDKLN